MKICQFSYFPLFIVFTLISRIAQPQTHIEIKKPMTSPNWALMERELLRANSEACEEFAATYLDERGYLLHTPRWGTLDGNNDAIASFYNWTRLYALGASESILELSDIPHIKIISS